MEPGVESGDSGRTVRPSFSTIQFPIHAFPCKSLNQSIPACYSSACIPTHILGRASPRTTPLFAYRYPAVPIYFVLSTFNCRLSTSSSLNLCTRHLPRSLRPSPACFDQAGARSASSTPLEPSTSNPAPPFRFIPFSINTLRTLFCDSPALSLFFSYPCALFPSPRRVSPLHHSTPACSHLVGATFSRLTPLQSALTNSPLFNSFRIRTSKNNPGRVPHQPHPFPKRNAPP